MLPDISLPNSIEFEILDPPPSIEDFIETLDRNFDVSYNVKADSVDKIAQLILITPQKQKILIQFNAKGRIGIKESTLYFNAENVIHIDTVCSKSENSKHSWKSELQSGTFELKSCLNCGRYVSNKPL